MISRNDKRKSSNTLACDEIEKVVIMPTEHAKGKKKKKKKKKQPRQGMKEQEEGEEENDNAGEDGPPSNFEDRSGKEAQRVQEEYTEPGRATKNESGAKLERKDSLRRKFGAFIRRGGSELPAVINRSLKPIKRSLSFNKDLHRVRDSSNVRWYSSLGSLAEDPGSETELKPTNERELLSPRMQITRTRSFVDKAATTSPRWRSSTISVRLGSSYDHRTECYDSAIDLNKPPCQATSLPTLALSATDFFTQEDDAERTLPSEPSRVGNGWEHWRTSTRNLSVQRLDRLTTKPQNSVRSRSLTQLDVLGNSMLDTGDHRLGSGPPPLEQQPYHHHHHYHHHSHLHDHHQHQDQNQQQQQQQQQLQQPSHQHHQTHQLHHPQNVVEGSPRFLAPSASFEAGHSNRRHKLSRSQVSSSEYFSVSIDLMDDSTMFDREEFLPATKGICLADALTSVCERRGIDLSNVVVLDSFSSPLPLTTTDTSSLGGKHLRLTVAKEERLNSRSANQKISQSVSLRKSTSGVRNGTVVPLLLLLLHFNANYSVFFLYRTNGQNVMRSEFESRNTLLTPLFRHTTLARITLVSY